MPFTSLACKFTPPALSVKLPRAVFQDPHPVPTTTANREIEERRRRQFGNWAPGQWPKKTVSALR